MAERPLRRTDETRTVIEREDVLSILAIVPIRRWRWSAQLAGGVEYERETRVLLDAPEGIRLSDRRDDLVSLIGRIGFANYRTHAFSISREDGISLGLGGRIARERNATPEFPRDYAEVTASLAGYRTLPLGGFARPVLAARVGALRRTGEGAEPSSIGGVSGAPYDIFGLTVGPGGLLLPVRGFERGVRAGTRAWTASAELRMPLAIPGRRPPWSPFFIDRVSLTAFGDMGDASCTATEAAIYLSCQRANTAAQPLASVGGELVTDLGIGAWFFARTRLGLAFPVSGPTRSPAVYFRFGPAF